MYDYYEAVKDDVLEFIREEIDFTDYDDLDELEEKLNDDLWDEDSVTGNASGSYTFSSYEAEENLCHNWNLLLEVLEEFGYDDISEIIKRGPEVCDVIIRCYVLGSAISDALKEIEDEFDAAHIEEDEEADAE